MILASVKRITVSVSDDVYRQARIRAAELGKSLSALVAEFLNSLSEREAEFARLERLVVSYWDAAILEASRSLGCDVVLSEDLTDGHDYAGVRVENPFLVGP